MRREINSAADLGFTLRAVRKSAKVRLDDLSATVGVAKKTTSDLERGKGTVRLETALRLLSELGIKLSVDFPDEVQPTLARVEKEASDRVLGLVAPRPANRGSWSKARPANEED